jgi:hypothetical protein
MQVQLEDPAMTVCMSSSARKKRMMCGKGSRDWAVFTNQCANHAWKGACHHSQRSPVTSTCTGSEVIGGFLDQFELCTPTICTTITSSYLILQTAYAEASLIPVYRITKPPSETRLKKQNEVKMELE